MEADMRGHRYKSVQGNSNLPSPFPWLALLQEALQGSNGWKVPPKRAYLPGAGEFGCEVRSRGKGGTSFGLCSAEAVGLELNSKDL